MFRQAIHVGELVTFLASINYTGNTSMEVGVKVLTEDIRNQVIRHANSCFFTMVAVDEQGQPTPVPTLTPVAPDEIHRYQAAHIRRELRKEFETRLRQLKPAQATESKATQLAISATYDGTSLPVPPP